MLEGWLAKDPSCNRHMARGNDGNLLQHAIEVGVAEQLACELRSAASTEFSLVCTHAMAPYEPLKDLANAPSAARLRGRLALAAGTLDEEQLPLLVKTYRRVGATHARYPNSAVLVRSLIQSMGLDITGRLFDIDEKTVDRLRSELPEFTTVLGEWRKSVDALFFDQRTGRRGWLFTMDPYKFCVRRQNPGVIDLEDVETIACALKRYTSTSAPGAALLFLYGMFPSERLSFYDAATTHLRHGFESCGVVTVRDLSRHGGAKRHVALVLGTSVALVASALNAAQAVLPGLAVGHDPVVALPWNQFERAK